MLYNLKIKLKENKQPIKNKEQWELTFTAFYVGLYKVQGWIVHFLAHILNPLESKDLLISILMKCLLEKLVYLQANGLHLKDKRMSQLQTACPQEKIKEGRG